MATGAQTEGVENLRDLIAATSQWQAWGRWDSGQAKKRVFLYGADESQIEESSGPYIVIEVGDAEDVAVAQGTYFARVPVRLTITSAREPHEDNQLPEQFRLFSNLAAALMDGIKTLLGTPGYVIGSSVRKIGAPFLEKVGDADRRLYQEYELTLGATG